MMGLVLVPRDILVVALLCVDDRSLHSFSRS